jgi:hypothetical protein
MRRPARLSVVERNDYIVVVVGLVALVPLAYFLSPGNFTVALLADVAAITGVVGVLHVLPRPPELTVIYRNEARPDRLPIFTIEPPGIIDIEAIEPAASHSLHVWVRNDSKRGEAEAVEVRFDGAGAPHVFNEAGNFPNPNEVDATVYPHRFTAGARVLAPGAEWCIARLFWTPGSAPTDSTLTWQAYAKGMKPREGVVRLRVGPGA